MLHAPERSITMTATRSDGQVIITLTGHSAAPRSVTYELTVTGASRTRHAGRTHIDSHSRVLSRVRIAAISPGRATLTVTEDRGSVYDESLTF